MVDLTVQRIGHACKWMNPGIETETKKQEKALVESYNQKTTTVSHMATLDRDAAYTKLWGIVSHNMTSLRNHIHWLSKEPMNLRMIRISSDFLPLYTHVDNKWFYDDVDARNYVADRFAEIGQLIRRNNIRASFHPGQFCVLNSTDPAKRQNGVEEFEYHVDMARWMGFGNQPHEGGFAINVHTGSKDGGTDGLLSTVRGMSTEARNLITIENDEFSHGLDSVLTMADEVAIVMDIHHNWINTGGEYIQPDDPRIQRVIDSWQGVRPKMHLSTSREEYVEDEDNLPDFNALVEAGYKKTKLKAHSDMCYNTAVNDWALGFSENFDIMVEAKNKNLASRQLYEQAVSKSII